MTRPFLTLCAAALTGLGALRSVAQEPAPASRPYCALRAELLPAKPLFNPDCPIRVRFTLVNTAVEPIDIPLDAPQATDLAGLPLQLVFGGGEQHFLAVIYESESPKDIPPPAAVPAKADAPRSLRLGAHSTVGVELDLRRHYQAVRYAGNYKLEWRPLDGAVGTVTAEFRVEPRKDAVLVTDLPGKITFALDYDAAPLNVENFLDLVRDGFYNGLTFHRVISGYLIQGGCPSGDGKGLRKDGKLVPGEFHPEIPIDAGTLAMAHKPSAPNSASCQFFIALGRLPDLDGQYTIIGHTRDAESLRTLQQLTEVSTDRRDRPVSPLVIRSINLVAAESTRTRELERNTGEETTPANPRTR
jgi:peptidyl-prolyl cis-trans isomerase B (cyclophilin B)